MTHTLTLPSREFVLGDQKYIGAHLRAANGADLSAITAGVAITDSDGAAVLPATVMNTSGTKRLKIFYLLETGAAKTITRAGTYRAVYTATYGAEVMSWQQTLTVKANPF